MDPQIPDGCYWRSIDIFSRGYEDNVGSVVHMVSGRKLVIVRVIEVDGDCVYGVDTWEVFLRGALGWGPEGDLAVETELALRRSGLA